MFSITYKHIGMQHYIVTYINVVNDQTQAINIVKVKKKFITKNLKKTVEIMDRSKKSVKIVVLMHQALGL